VDIGTSKIGRDKDVPLVRQRRLGFSRALISNMSRGSILRGTAMKSDIDDVPVVLATTRRLK
jgi:hypothetical protein